MKTLVLALTIVLPIAAIAGEPVHPPRPACLHCLVCPDDYHPKPWPCLPKAICGGWCDDYCKKPLPNACPVPGVFCDDYCKKPLPCGRAAHWSLWLACPPAVREVSPFAPRKDELLRSKSRH